MLNCLVYCQDRNAIYEQKLYSWLLPIILAEHSFSGIVELVLLAKGDIYNRLPMSIIGLTTLWFD